MKAYIKKIRDYLEKMLSGLPARQKKILIISLLILFILVDLIYLYSGIKGNVISHHKIEHLQAIPVIKHRKDKTNIEYENTKKYSKEVH